MMRTADERGNSAPRQRPALVGRLPGEFQEGRKAGTQETRWMPRPIRENASLFLLSCVPAFLIIFLGNFYASQGRARRVELTCRGLVAAVGRAGDSWFRLAFISVD